MTSRFKYQIVDAFTSKPYSGNPAAVVIQDGDEAPKQLSDAEMLNIAKEMNLSETAFITPTDEADVFGLRWWTPGVEVSLCGHATVAATAVLSSHPKYSSIEKYRFQTQSGELVTRKIPRSDGSPAFELDFPATVPEVVEGALQDDAYMGPLRTAMGDKAEAIKQIWRSKFDVIVEVDLKEGDHLGDWAIEASPLAVIPARGISFTAVLPRSDGSGSPQFHSRFLGPQCGIVEDPVTGSLHCALAPLYSQKFGKGDAELFASQGGDRRGEISVVWDESRDRVLLRGQAVLMASGQMVLP